MQKIATLILTFICISFARAQVPVLQFENSYGGSNIDRGFSILQTKDGGFITAGETRSNDGQVHGNHAVGEPDFWVVKLSKAGKIQWQTPLGGTNDETAFCIQQTDDGGYIVAGQANSDDGQVTGNHGVLDFWVVKLDSTGHLVWQRSLGGSKNDFATNIQQTKDGGYIVVGGSHSNDGDVTKHHGYDLYSDYWIVKLDAAGNKQWARTYGGSYGDVAMSVIQINDGSYIVAGNSASNDGDVTNVHDSVYGDAWIIKLDKKGKLLWQKTYGGSDYEQANSIVQTKDGGFAFAGWSRSYNNGDVKGSHGNYDFWVLKLDSVGTLVWQKPLGGSNGDLAYSIQQTKDKGYVVAGGTVSTDGQVTGLHGSREDFWVVKLDNTGTLQWQKTLGGSEIEEGRSVDQTTDGGYIIAGWSGFSNVNNGDVTGNHGNYDVWIAKLSVTGGSAVETAINTKTQTARLNVSPNPASDVLDIHVVNAATNISLHVTNKNGSLVFQKDLSGPTGEYYRSIDIRQFQPGLYYVTLNFGDTVLTRAFIKQ